MHNINIIKFICFISLTISSIGLFSEEISNIELSQLKGGGNCMKCGNPNRCVAPSSPECTVSNMGACNGSSIINGSIGYKTYRKCEKSDNLNHTCTNNVDYCPSGKYVCSWIPYQNPERICEPMYESDGNYMVKGCK